MYNVILDLFELRNKYNLNIKGVVHIGAHTGEEFNIYKNLDIKNMMFFEPDPNTFNILKQNVISDDNIMLYNIALGNTIGETEMFVASNGGASSSILEPYIHLQQYGRIKFESKIKVPITKLDTFINPSKNYNFINIDVQGYELEVFKGAAEYLNDIDYILSEVNREELYKDCAMIDQLDEFLNTYKFKRVETVWAGKTWGDAFYIKNK